MQMIVRGEVLYLGAGGWQAVLGKQRLAPFASVCTSRFAQMWTLTVPKAPEATEASSRNETSKSQRPRCSKELIPFSLLIIFPGCRSQVSHPFSSSLDGN